MKFENHVFFLALVRAFDLLYVWESVVPKVSKEIGLTPCLLSFMRSLGQSELNFPLLNFPFIRQNRENPKMYKKKNFAFMHVSSMLKAYKSISAPSCILYCHTLIHSQSCCTEINVVQIC